MREAVDGCVGARVEWLPPAEYTSPSAEPGKLHEAIPTQVLHARALLFAENGVFGCFGHAELDHFFCLNVYGLSILWIAANAGFAVG